MTYVTNTADGKLVTADATGAPTLKPTGKVLAGIASSGALVVLVALLTAVNPELLAPLGPWSGVVYAGVVALAGFLGSYIKAPQRARKLRLPLREEGGHPTVIVR